jgi:hypothetical protein
LICIPISLQGMFLSFIRGSGSLRPALLCYL